jgi:ribose transport system permease protein
MQKADALRSAAGRFLSEYGMLGVLLALCVYFSLVTVTERRATGAAAVEELVAPVRASDAHANRVLILVSRQPEDSGLADAIVERLMSTPSEWTRGEGEPRDARRAVEALVNAGTPPNFILCSSTAARWALVSDLKTDFPTLKDSVIVVPRSYRYPSFLKTENLLNIANQIAVIAIVAIGMTMVIITGGIDLSVGSLIALSAVAAALFIRDAAGGVHAGAAGMTLACLGGIAVCGLVGVFTSGMVTWFAIPPFIVTLGMMLVSSGLAYILAKGQSVYQVPDSFVWLGRGADVGIPNAVVLTLVLYVAAHLLMSRTRLGRHIYAVGSNREAARLSGVPVRMVALFVYASSGLLAGLGGVVMASQLKSGSPTYGQSYELYVIAAVVVGGTSLTGGKGKMFGTLIGALIIAVIQNGMNLRNVESFTQKVVLGLVILGAVLADRLRERGWQGLRSA